MKSTGTFSEIRQLHAKYQNRTLAIDEEIEALKREKAELSMACDVVYAIYRTAFQHENGADVDVLHGLMKASLAELDHIWKTRFRNNQPLLDPEGRERASATTVSRCVDPALWTLFAMKIREENGPSLEQRVERMVTEHVTRNAFIVERAIDEYEYTCKVVWDTCESDADFDAAVAKVMEIGSEDGYSDEETARALGKDCRFEARLAVRARARVRQARARLGGLVGKR